MTVTLTKTPAKPTDSCPAWCTATHADDLRHYREHRGDGVRTTSGMFAVVSWLEPVTPSARYLAVAPQVYFSLGDADLQLSARQASSLAAMMADAGRLDAAELLREMVALIGAES